MYALKSSAKNMRKSGWQSVKFLDNNNKNIFNEEENLLI